MNPQTDCAARRAPRGRAPHRLPLRIGLTAGAVLFAATPARGQGQHVTPDMFQLACREIQVTPVGQSPDLRNLVDWCGAVIGSVNPFSGLLNNPARLPGRDTIAALAGRAAARIDTSLSARGGGPTIVAGGAVPGVTPAPGVGLTEGAIILGLTDFLIERVEGELQAWLLPTLFEKICRHQEGNPDGENLLWLFPNTCDLLRGAADVGLATAGSAFKAAIRRDVQGVPLALLNRAWPSQTTSTPDWAYARLMVSLLQTREPVSLQSWLQRLDRPEVPAEVRHLARFVDSTLAHSRTTRAPTSLEGWNAVVMSALYNLRLDTPGASCARCDQIVNFIGRFAAIQHHLIAAEQTLRSLRTASTADSTGRAGRADMVHGFVGHVRGVLENIDPTLSDSVRLALEHATDVVVGLVVGDHSTAIAAVTRLATVLRIRDSLPQDAVRLLTFAADLASAQHSDDVKDAVSALASAAAGQGQKRAKRHGVIVGIQAYGGVGFGSERALVEGSADPRDGYVGLHFPIGIELTGPNMAFSLFAQILDLGSVATTRLGDGETQDSTTGASQQIGRTPEVTFRQVLAPGGFITYAVPRTPLSVGAGVSWVPDLRELKDSGAPNRRVDQLRWTMFAGIDIRIFP